MKRKLTLLFFLIIAISVAVSALASTHSAYFHYHMGLEKALLAGNISYLEKESKIAKYPVQRKIVHIAYLTSRMKLTEAFREGKACFKSKKIRKKNALLAISCGVFAAGAALTSQKVAEWARLIAATKTYGIPALKKMTGENYKIPYFYGIDPKNFSHAPPATVKRGKSRGLMAWAHCLKKVTGYSGATAWIQVNHKTVCFMVDTGTSGSLLTKKTAMQLGVTSYKQGFAYISGFSEKSMHEKWGIIARLKIGNTIISNVPVTVANKAKFNIIGGDTLRLLGSLMFTAKGLVINPLKNAACSRPMAYAYKSLVWPLGPVMKAQVNGHPARVLFDSGLATPLFTQSAKYLKNNKSYLKNKGSISGEYSSMTAYSTQAIFSLGSTYKPTSMAMIYAPRYQGYVPLRAGFGILKHYNVALNFDAHTACFLPAG